MPSTVRYCLYFIIIAVTAGPAWAQDTTADAQQIVRAAIEAVGGPAALARLKRPMMWMERGTFHGMGDGLPFVAQYAAKWPHWYRQEIENAFVITVNGDRAWMEGGTGQQTLTGPMLEEQRKQVRVAWATRLFPLTEAAYTLQPVAGIDVDEQTTIGLLATHRDGRDIRFYFDEKTYLLRKVTTTVISPQFGSAPVTSEAYYSKYKVIAGIKMPGRVRVFYDRKLFIESETVDYKTAATLDPKLFSPPKQGN